MIFQKNPAKYEDAVVEPTVNNPYQSDEVETVVGPSVNVEGDFASEGNITVKGSVAGSVHTSRFLSVETGAKIMANVRAGSARVAGEVKGNMKIKDSLELTSTSKVLGDIEVKTLSVEPGAIIYGKVVMPGADINDVKQARQRASRRSEDLSQVGE
jgi:cytoskeletal protein CcmA (bactofilin family)